MRTRTRISLAGLVLALAAAVTSSALAVVPVIGTPPTLTPVTINAGPGEQADPHVSGDWAVYTELAGGVESVWYYNFATGSGGQIPLSSSNEDSSPDISGSKIVFSRTTIGVKSGVMVFDAATQTVAPREIDPAPSTNRLGDAIGGDTVAYVDYGVQQNGEIVIHDLASDTSVRVTNDSAFDQNPSVSPDGNTVVWAHCQVWNNCDIWQATRAGATWTAATLSTSTGAPWSYAAPKTDGARVVYPAVRAGGAAIFWRPSSGGLEQHLDFGIDQMPSITGNYIAFVSQPTDLASTDLFVYDIATNRLYQLTDTPLLDEQLTDITTLPDGRQRLVWADDAAGFDQRDVKGATFRLGDTTAPQVSVPGPLTANATSPAGAAVTFTATATDDVTANPTVTCAPASGSVFPAGTTTVTCTAADAAGNSSTASFPVTIRGAAAQMGDLIAKTVAYLHLPALQAPLQARLQAALDAIVAANKPAACTALQLYIAFVKALPGTTLTPAQKAELIADASQIRSVLAC